jgi:hypothetical protein
LWEKDRLLDFSSISGGGMNRISFASFPATTFSQ